MPGKMKRRKYSKNKNYIRRDLIRRSVFSGIILALVMLFIGVEWKLSLNAPESVKKEDAGQVSQNKKDPVM